MRLLPNTAETWIVATPTYPIIMFRFLSSLFSPTVPETHSLDPSLIAVAIERAVEGTDRRLRALGDYRKRLCDPVQSAARHVIDIVDGFPEPAEISREAYGNDPRLRAFFSSGEHLLEVLGSFADLRRCPRDLSVAGPEQVFGLLVMVREERNVLGMELEGENLRKDVLQVAVNFMRHQYLCPTPTEASSRWELKKRAFDFLVEKALERLAGEKKKRGELEHHRHLLRRKLAAMKSGDWGLSAIFAEDGEIPGDLPTLEVEIEAIDAELGRTGSNTLGLEQSLELVADTLGRPADWLVARELELRLDYRGIKVADSAAGPSQELRLTELVSGTGGRRIVFLGRVPRTDIPEKPDFLKQASRYLS